MLTSCANKECKNCKNLQWCIEHEEEPLNRILKLFILSKNCFYLLKTRRWLCQHCLAVKYEIIEPGELEDDGIELLGTAHDVVDK